MEAPKTPPAEPERVRENGVWPGVSGPKSVTPRHYVGGMDSGGSAGTATATGTGVVGDVIVADDSPFVALADGVDAVLASSLAPASGNDAAGVLAVIERDRRRLYAAVIETMDQIDRRSLHQTDGHASVQVQIRHVAKLSGSEAHAAMQVMRMFRHLALIRDALHEGVIGVEQVQLLARVFSNPRVRGAMELRQERFIHQAQTMHYAMFEARVREWERLIDEDGAPPRGEMSHENRNAQMTQSDIDLDWELKARFGSMQGSRVNDIWGHYIDAEWHRDWDAAVAEHGDLACEALMPRTPAQRRADAFEAMVIDAAGADGSAVPPGFCHDIVWHADTIEELLRRFAGADPRPLDPDTYRCETIDGTPLDPTEAAANLLVSSFRRVVINSASVTIDAGRKRLFDGVLKTVVRIQSGTTCVWPGCQCPATNCETDHLREHDSGGSTNPDNGAPLCGKHNRWKQKGYTVRRNPDATWTTTRPDGSIIDP